MGSIDSVTAQQEWGWPLNYDISIWNSFHQCRLVLRACDIRVHPRARQLSFWVAELWLRGQTGCSYMAASQTNKHWPLLQSPWGDTSKARGVWTRNIKWEERTVECGREWVESEWMRGANGNEPKGRVKKRGNEGRNRQGGGGISVWAFPLIGPAACVSVCVCVCAPS